MNLALSDEERMLADSARAFYRGRAMPDAPCGHWREFAELGWLALPIPEEQGGLGAQDSTLAVLLEQFGRARASEPFTASVVLAAGLLTRVGGNTAAGLLELIARGERIVTVAAESKLVACASPHGWHLTGAVPLLLAGASAQTMLLPARDGEGMLRLFAIQHDTPGLTVTPVATLDDSAVADLTLTNAAAELVSAQGIECALAFAFDRATALACTDALGAIGALIDATVGYTHSRIQFGKPLGTFQVVEHQLVDMFIAQEEARAAVQLAVLATGAQAPFRQRAVSAAKVKVGRAARTAAHTAVQLHGAMGVTDELEVGAYVKRLMGFEAAWGSCDAHLQRYATLLRDEPATLGYFLHTATDHGPAFRLDVADAAFRSQVRDYLHDAVPPHVRRAQQLTTTVYAEADVAVEWHRILAKRGWSAANWPAAGGGTGWTPMQRYLFAQELGVAGAPVISPIGLPLVGPVLMHFGTEEQQRRYLPMIVSGEELWCQGFSEPGAGSDLAALATRAERDGEEYVVNGSKIWTTQAHVAHFMAALVRTGAPAARREGITFLVIDLRTPGVVVRPIMTIGGDHEVNQVFFDGVRVPMANRVGAEGDGWKIGRFLLDYERGGDISSAGHRALLGELYDFAQSAQLDDPAAFFRAFAEVSIDVDILEMLELRSLQGAASSPATASILKVRASEIQQSVTELALRALGREALRWHPTRPLHELPGASPASAFSSRYLNSRATTIFGGAREIQKSIIARAVLPR